MTVDYRPTVRLPRTDFAMRANLPEREPQILARWVQERVAERLAQQNKGSVPFVLHDGPPYANNDIHQGHALNKTLKDIVIKYRAMSGSDCDVIPGWDCHGLPIELAVDKQLGSKKRELSAVEFRRACRAYAQKWLDVQRDSFRRLGVFMRWDAPYRTMDESYEAQTVRILADLAERGALYRQKKPVHWCPKDRTALAEAEIEYHPHTSPSIFVGMQLVGDPSVLSPALAGHDVRLVIWTTTPWTLPANLAIAAHPEFQYVGWKLRAPTNPNAAGQVVVVARELLGRFLAACDPAGLLADGSVDPSGIVASFDGKSLAGLQYRHPWLPRQSPVLLGDHVTLEQGSGLVHTAPGHGHDDYVLGKKHGLEVLAPVDHAGRYTADVPELTGTFVFDANPVITQKLHDSGHLLNKVGESISHNYPHCWRCDGPVLFRATDQWFVSMQHGDLRGRALRAIDEEVQWIPAWGQARIRAMMENRPDWCISRQRAWGVPITVFYCESCEHCVCDAAVMRHVADVFQQETADAWVSRSAQELLPPGFACPSCGKSSFRKESDILDVWFDSGVSWSAVLETRGQPVPADLYLEGSDQHRGWFNSSMVAALATRDRPPFKAVLTHGFVVDGKGIKLSKRLGNGVPMPVMLQKYGADILRLWVAAEDYREDIRLSDEILDNLSDGYRRIRNTLRYVLGSLDGFDPARDAVPVAELSELDRWALEMTARWVDRMHAAYQSYEFHLAYHATQEFCSKTLSAGYFDVLKDRLYTRSVSDPLRRGSQMVLWRIADALCRLLAPICSFTADEAWRHLPGTTDAVFLAGLPTADQVRAGLDRSEGESLVSRYARFHDTVRAAVTHRLEALKAEQQPLFKEAKELRARVSAGTASEQESQRLSLLDGQLVGSPLDAAVTIRAGAGIKSFVHTFSPAALAELLIVSAVTVSDEVLADPEAIEVGVAPAPGERCDRCWVYSTRRGAESAHPTLCPRCAQAVRADFPALAG